MTNLFRLFYLFIVFSIAGIFCHKKNRGKRLVHVFQMLGPSFIKFGQTLSVRPDIVGEKIANDLASLQDKVPPFSTKKALKIVKKELGKNVHDLFKDFDKNPVAAASIAQVYKAVTHSGEAVAVKILRPGVERKFGRDINFLYFVAGILNRFKRLKRLKFISVVDVFAETVRKEMDLRLEAAAASELLDNCQNDEGFYVPKIFWNLISRKVLVIEWIDGIPVNDKKALIKAGFDLEKITKHLSTSFLNQAFRDGFFHADTHPGNLFVDKHGNIAPVDFGIMGRLDKKTRVYVAEILRGFLTGDYQHVAKIHFDAGYVPKTKSIDDFALACRAISEPIMGLPANKVSIAKLLALLFKVTEDFEMETQPQLLLLQKTMVLIEGVGQTLYPEVNMWQQAEEWIRVWAKDNLGFEAKIRAGLKDIAEILCDLPKKLKKLDDVLAAMAEKV